MTRLGSLLVIFFIVAACGGDDPAPITDVDLAIVARLDSLGITATRDASGVYIYTTASNPSGVPVASGNVAAIYYTLSDFNGGTIASYQRNNGDSLLLKQGVSAIYPVGLDIGLSLMRVGETYGLVIPPNLAYQDLTSGAIDPEMIALIEVEVVGVSAEADLFSQELTDINDFIVIQNLNDTLANPTDPVISSASGVSYKRTERGNGPLPINGDSIIINYTGRFLGGGNFDSRQNFTIVWGADIPRPLIPGFAFGISLMQTAESALFIIPSSQAYRESAQVIPASIIGDLIEDSIIPDYVSTIPPYRTLVFDVTRVD